MKLIYKCLMVVLILTGIGCESIVDGLNNDPNNATDAPDPLILTAAMIANAAVQEGHANRVTNMWTGYFNGADRQYADYALYNMNAGNFNTEWNNVYQGTLAQTRLITERAGEAGERHIMGIAKIIEANAIGTATERWGDVPFSEAVNFDITNPAFDPQASGVYPAIQALLTSAIEDLKSGAGASPGSADIYFSGDVDKWVAVAHSLKARYYMDMKDYSSAYNEALQGILDPSGSMMTPHGTTNDGNLNFIFDFLVQSRSGDMDAGTGEDGEGGQVYAADLLDPDKPEAYRGNAKTNETARFYYNYLDAGSDSYTGRLEPNYQSTATGDSITGRFGSDASFHVVTYMENVLTLAEAGARTQAFATGLDYLNEYRAYMATGGYIDATVTAIHAFQYDPYESGDFDTGGMANNGLSSDDALLMEILEERYLTFIGTSLGWNDVRRTQNDAVGIPIEPLLNKGTELPQRMIYGQDELNSNTNAPDPVPTIFDKMEIY